MNLFHACCKHGSLICGLLGVSLTHTPLRLEVKLGSSPSACILWPVAGQKKFQWSKLRSMICMVGVLGIEGVVLGQSIEEVAPFATGDVLILL